MNKPEHRAPLGAAGADPEAQTRGWETDGTTRQEGGRGTASSTPRRPPRAPLAARRSGPAHEGAGADGEEEAKTPREGGEGGGADDPGPTSAHRAA